LDNKKDPPQKYAAKPVMADDTKFSGDMNQYVTIQQFQMLNQ
jgi:hypothetical protein